MADWTRLSYVVVDVEGNGQQPPDLVGSWPPCRSSVVSSGNR
ncbi:MAG: hypothetical protein ACRDR6_31580 [Pseudonocardiaceae bacterium]